MSLFDSTRRYQRLFSLTAEELASPTTAQIEDTGSIYQLDVPPYTRYTSNGEELVAVADESNIDALVTASIAILNATLLQKVDASVVTALATRVAALEGATGPSAPSIGTTVTISDTTPLVGDTLTAGGGTPTGGTSPYTAFYQWYSTTVGSGKAPISDQTSSTLSVTQALEGAQISVFKWVIDATGSTSVPVESALTTAVGGTQATAITLSGLPASSTTATTASIGWALTPSGLTGTVFSRLDAYLPAASPNPFALSNLAVGSHRVDFYYSYAGDGTDVDPVVPLTTYSWSIAAVPTVTLSGTPTTGTTSTSASINWTLTGAGVVYWRRDGLSIAIASNPVVMTGLSVGSHTVDFYISADGTGTDVSLGSPSATYTWTISAAGVIPLPQLAYPADVNITGSSGTYDGVNAKVVSATTRVGPYVDASGVTMDIHRIVQNGSVEQRSELLWINPAAGGTIYPLREWWWAIVVERISGETQPSSATDDEVLVHQTHTSMSGSTQPVIALYDYGQGDIHRWRVSGCSHAGSTHNPGDAGYTNPWITAGETRPAAGVKWRYIVRYKPGWDAGHDKIVQVWRGKPGLDAENITTGGSYTGVNDYNDGNNGLTAATYIRKGLYKYSGSTWNATPIGYRISRIYLAENTTGASVASMLERAEASVSWAR